VVKVLGMEIILTIQVLIWVDLVNMGEEVEEEVRVIVVHQEEWGVMEEVVDQWGEQEVYHFLIILLLMVKIM
jgi:hypothetical protein